jgi:DNA-binding transcriptional LysR family regulator
VLIWFVEDALDQATYDLLHELAPDAHPQIRTNNIAGQVQAAEAGLGIAFLPSFIADRNPRLQRIMAARSRVVRSYWLSVPRNLSRLARVRSIMNLIDRLIADCDGFNAESR